MAKYGINALVIGERIKQELKKQGKTSVWLAEQLGCHRTNIYKVSFSVTVFRDARPLTEKLVVDVSEGLCCRGL